MFKATLQAVQDLRAAVATGKFENRYPVRVTLELVPDVDPVDLVDTLVQLGRLPAIANVTLTGLDPPREADVAESGECVDTSATLVSVSE